MDRALVVVDDSEQSHRLLRAAGDIAAGVGANLYLFSSLDPDEFDETRAALDAIGKVEDTSYGKTDAMGAVHSRLERTVAEVFDDPPFDYETIGVVTEEGDRASKILAAADEHDCDHVFVAGKRRSPTGKVLFGDTVQKVLLNFDGEVTVRLG
ncbi:universal stress protein [Halomarina salina]|uniref:Universal stress protein n=1 Tax=Halomarina salina TaxID=1872699 RepID=A0ABD5RT57_9EURY|nr:universal stress protein [Halomarina salina]